MIFNVTKEDRYKTGVYFITNLINGKKYVGSTSNNFYNRFHQHISDYKAGKRHIRVLYRAIDKYGIDNFEFKIVLVCSKEDCLKNEQIYIDAGSDYNCAMIAGSLLGLVHQPDSKTRTIIGGLHHTSKIVYQFSKNGDFIQKHNSIIEALKILGKTKNGSSHISQSCIGITYSAFGYRWSFKKKLLERANRLGKHKIKLVKNEFSQEFKSQQEASDYIKKLGFSCNQGRFPRAIKTGEKVYGFSIIKL